MPVSRAEGVRSLGLELRVLWVLRTGVLETRDSDPLLEQLNLRGIPTLTPVFPDLS